MNDLKPAADEEPVSRAASDLRATADTLRMTLRGIAEAATASGREPTGVEREAALSLGFELQAIERQMAGSVLRDYALAQGCVLADPVTPSRLRLRVDTGPVGYLWLEWLGACARVAGIADESGDSWGAAERYLPCGKRELVAVSPGRTMIADAPE